MRTRGFGLSRDATARSPWTLMEPSGAPLFLDVESLSSSMASGSEPLTLMESSTPSRISTFTSKIESWSLNLSSRAVKVLNISYWIFTALSCILFFTSHWSIFLAFLIPALIMNHLRVVRKVWKIASTCHSGPSMSGT